MGRGVKLITREETVLVFSCSYVPGKGKRSTESEFLVAMTPLTVLSI